jgi:glycosyltransferase involved in cell wall biosynthesis
MKISIAIPTYAYEGNGVVYLANSLKLLCKQTYKNFNVVISDHSIDNSIYDLIQLFNEKLDIHYFKNERGRGIISPNLNESLKQCDGEWIKILFQDDFLYNEFSLEKTVNAIQQDINKKWLITRFVHTIDGYNYYNDFYPAYHDKIYLGVNTIGCPSVISIKNENILFFNEELNWLMDVEYYKRMYDMYNDPIILNEITVVNRNASDRLSHRITEETKINETNLLKSIYD